jgi:hypothetical protein
MATTPSGTQRGRLGQRLGRGEGACQRLSAPGGFVLRIRRGVLDVEQVRAAGEAVAIARHGRHQIAVVAERAPQRGDLRLHRVGFDAHARPCALAEFGERHRPPFGFDEREQQFESTRADLDWQAVGGEARRILRQAVAAEGNDRLRRSR